MMNPEHPSNDDDVIELTDEVPIELTPADEVLEPMRAEKPVFPGNMVKPIEVSILPPGEPFLVEHAPERVVPKQKPIHAGEEPVLGMSPEKVEEAKRYGNGM
jgi:hypothetical protein